MPKSWFSRYLFEKVENPFGATIVTYFWCFGGRICAIFDRKSIIFWIKLGFSCLASLRRPREDLYIAQEGFLEASWLQDASIFVQNALRKKRVFQWGKIEFAPSWPEIRPWRAQEPLPDPPGRVLGTSWGEPGDKRRSRRPQGCKNDLQERPKWPKIDLKMTPKATPNDHQKTLSAFQFSFVYFKNVTHQLTKVS